MLDYYNAVLSLIDQNTTDISQQFNNYANKIKEIAIKYPNDSTAQSWYPLTILATTSVGSCVINITDDCYHKRDLARSIIRKGFTF